MEVIKQRKTPNLYMRTFVIPIYSSKVCFIRFKNRKGWDEAMKYIESLGVLTDELNTEEWMFAYGFCTKEKTNQGFIHFLFINAAKEYSEEYTNTLSHECYHLVEHISTHHGLKHEEGEANEPQAYLTGYLYDYLSKI